MTFAVATAVAIEKDLNYYRSIVYIKKKFIKSLEACCSKRIEIYKIWAHWLIGVLSKNEYNYHLLVPEHILAAEEHVIKHMTEKGVAHHDAARIYESLVKDYGMLYQMFGKEHYEMLKNSKALYAFSKCIMDHQTADGGLHIITIKDLDVVIKITTVKYQKIKSQYVGPKELFIFYLFEHSFNYYLLDGKSLQWSMPGEVFNYLNTVGLSGELFASPSNSYHSNFFSLFYVDSFFGSKGNFFSPLTAQRLLAGGLYEINPPFVEQIFASSCHVICSAMEKCENVSLGFVYIMPLWSDHQTYDLLISSPFFIDRLLLEKFQHFYQSGNKYISASFDTVLIIVGNLLFRQLDHSKAILANIKSRFETRPSGSQMEDNRDHGLILI